MTRIEELKGALQGARWVHADEGSGLVFVWLGGHGATYTPRS